MSKPLFWCAFEFVGEGPKTEVAGFMIGEGSRPVDGWEAKGDVPNKEVPVDFPSLITTVDLKISSSSFKALYLSSCDFTEAKAPPEGVSEFIEVTDGGT